jgi:hypothetical protein|nr:MAG TPA: hypothetical protein [Caudoviricetes sp.]
MKPFDLEKAKAGASICTRDGSKARIVCFDANNKRFPLVALIKDSDNSEEYPVLYTKDETVYKYDLSDGFEMLGWGNMKRNPKDVFACMIDKVSGKGVWESNPFVFAYEFVLVD